MCRWNNEVITESRCEVLLPCDHSTIGQDNAVIPYYDVKMHENGVTFLNVRHIEQEDCGAILEVASDWWGDNYSSDMFSKWYIHHFRETCLLAEENGKMIGFIMGFLSQSQPDEAYIRIVMIDPTYRGRGVGRSLYEKFFESVQFLERKTVRCVTAPRKKDSIAFHTRLGFRIEPQEQELEGVPTFLDYDGRGGNRVMFKKVLHY